MNKLLIIIFLFISSSIYCHENILIGDSQTFFLEKYCTKIKHIKKLSKPGIGVYELNKKIKSYNIRNKVKTITISIGVNDNYNDKGINELITNVKKNFPKSRIFIVQGSWGWGKVNTNKEKIKKYYKTFENLGCVIINKSIGHGDPHRDKKIYKEIIKIIENKI